MPANDLHPDDAAAVALLADELLAELLRLQLLKLAGEGARASLDQHGDVERQQYLGRVLEHLQTADTVLRAASGLLQALEAPPEVPLPEVPLPDLEDVVTPAPAPESPRRDRAHRPEQTSPDEQPRPTPVRPAERLRLPTEGDRPARVYLDRQNGTQGDPPTMELVGLDALLRPDLYGGDRG